MGKCHLIIFDILTLVPVYKSKIERNTQLRHQFKSITDIKLYLISISGLLQPRAGKILLLVINLKCMKHSSLTQAFGKTKS